MKPGACIAAWRPAPEPPKGQEREEAISEAHLYQLRAASWQPAGMVRS